jgi:hypothetical protein
MGQNEDANTWEAVRNAEQSYDQYLRIQQVGEVLNVLQEEQSATPQPRRTDQPLSLAKYLR